MVRFYMERLSWDVNKLKMGYSLIHYAMIILQLVGLKDTFL